MTDQTEKIETDEDDFYDDTPYTADTLRQENQRFEEEWAAENRQDEEQLRKATDADGNFKSLAHKMRYSEQEFPQWLPNAPLPSQYGADQEEQFWEDYTSFVQTGRLAGNLDALPDDEHRTERENLIREIGEHRRQAEIALRNGKTETSEIHNNLARHCENDLDKLPKPKRQIRAEEEAFKADEITADQLFDPDLADDPVWQSERYQHDSAVFVASQNQRARKYIRLPIEDAPYGNPKPCKPSNMIRFSLPDEAATQFKNEVYHSGGSEHPDAIFRRSWQWLHKHGYATTGERPLAKKQA